MTAETQTLRTPIFAAAILMFLAAVAPNARTASADYAQTLTGRLSGQLCSSSGTATGEAAGDLPGAFELSVDCPESEITGGTWRLAVKQRNADGSESERGQLTGRVLRGVVSRTAAGVLIGTALELVVTGGTGDYAAVTEGTGGAEFTADASASTQFTATLQLSF